jgi:hypothetical protein
MESKTEEDSNERRREAGDGFFPFDDYRDLAVLVC